MKFPLSVAIITYNEEENLPRTLDAIKDIAEEIIVVDSHSTDKTVEIAKNYGAKVFIENWKGFKDQKNSALEKCANEWILFIDADEVVSKGLKEEIIKAIEAKKADGFYINRKTYYIGKFLNFTWQPDWVLRLVRRSANPRWEGGNIHEYLRIDGKTYKLKGYLYHYTYKNLSEHFNKSLKYAKISAEEMYKNGKRFKLHKLIINPFWAFFRQYFIKLGFLDGIRGLSVSMSYLFSTFLKYLFLWELEQKEKNGKS
ncbi:MAG TPA: glycosyltransferase family 2 protein [Persephonella sp.]|nr:glycosyltransferase family 2 protein [Hydrogenothermaceae bacterium]HIQ25252.1 glycosyltransferase family 2 protein [Persephonella sp.]